MSKKPSIAELEAKIVELTEALQRERADAMNVRRRTEEDKARLGDFYKVMITREFLPALDNLERAIKHMPKDTPDTRNTPDHKPDHETPISRVVPWKQGFEGVAKQFEQCFAKLGIERIKTVGEIFDPKYHEAVQMEDGEGNVEVICEELQPGYRMGNDVIRHAMVKVKKEKK